MGRDVPFVQSPRAALNWRIRIALALPDATSNSLAHTNTDPNRRTDNQTRNCKLDPHLRALRHPRHTSTQIVLASLLTHHLLLPLQLLLARPYRALDIILALVLQQSAANRSAASALGGCLGDAGFDVGIVGGGVDVDVLLGLGIHGFGVEGSAVG